MIPFDTFSICSYVTCNMELYNLQDTWIKEVILLTEAVDEIITIDDFLAVSGLY